VECADYPWSRQDAQELHRALVFTFPTKEAALFLAAKIDISPAELAVDVPVLYLWREILDFAAAALRLRDLVTHARADRRAAANAGVFDAVLAAKRPVVTPEPRNEDGTSNFISGSADATELEALLFRDDLSISIGRVPMLIKTLEILTEVSKSVCLIRVEGVDDEGPFLAEGTGLRIAKDLVLTNHHVLKPRDRKPTAVKVLFGFDQGSDDSELLAKPLAADLASIVTDAADDWGIIRVPEIPAAWPSIQLANEPPFKEGDGAFIVQHPKGARKRLGFVRNTITGSDDRVVWYLTDTQQGSSGAPVFDAGGKLIALHHRGGAPVTIAGKPPLVKNEGIRISRVTAGLAKEGVAAAQ
jgi:S1-C subfamily serine protease